MPIVAEINDVLSIQFGTKTLTEKWQHATFMEYLAFQNIKKLLGQDKSRELNNRDIFLIMNRIIKANPANDSLLFQCWKQIIIKLRDTLFLIDNAPEFFSATTEREQAEKTQALLLRLIHLENNNLLCADYFKLLENKSDYISYIRGLSALKKLNVATEQHLNTLEKISNNATKLSHFVSALEFIAESLPADLTSLRTNYLDFFSSITKGSSPSLSSIEDISNIIEHLQCFKEQNALTDWIDYAQSFLTKAANIDTKAIALLRTLKLDIDNPFFTECLALTKAVDDDKAWNHGLIALKKCGLLTREYVDVLIDQRNKGLLYRFVFNVLEFITDYIPEVSLKDERELLIFLFSDNKKPENYNYFIELLKIIKQYNPTNLDRIQYAEIILSHVQDYQPNFTFALDYLCSLGLTSTRLEALCDHLSRVTSFKDTIRSSVPQCLLTKEAWMTVVLVIYQQESHSEILTAYCNNLVKEITVTAGIEKLQCHALLKMTDIAHEQNVDAFIQLEFADRVHVYQSLKLLHNNKSLTQSNVNALLERQKSVRDNKTHYAKILTYLHHYPSLASGLPNVHKAEQVKLEEEVYLMEKLNENDLLLDYFLIVNDKKLRTSWCDGLVLLKNCNLLTPQYITLLKEQDKKGCLPGFVKVVLNFITVSIPTQCDREKLIHLFSKKEQNTYSGFVDCLNIFIKSTSIELSNRINYAEIILNRVQLPQNFIHALTFLHHFNLTSTRLNELCDLCDREIILNFRHPVPILRRFAADAAWTTILAIYQLERSSDALRIYCDHLLRDIALTLDEVEAALPLLPARNPQNTPRTQLNYIQSIHNDSVEQSINDASILLLSRYSTSPANIEKAFTEAEHYLNVYTQGYNIQLSQEGVPQALESNQLYLYVEDEQLYITARNFANIPETFALDMQKIKEQQEAIRELLKVNASELSTELQFVIFECVRSRGYRSRAEREHDPVWRGYQRVKSIFYVHQVTGSSHVSLQAQFTLIWQAMHDEKFLCDDTVPGTKIQITFTTMLERLLIQLYRVDQQYRIEHDILPENPNECTQVQWNWARSKKDPSCPGVGCQKTAVFNKNHYPGNGPVF